MRFYHSYQDLLANNVKWAENKKQQVPSFFENLKDYQRPPFLFLGCSDSRVPIDTFTQTEPGELFIHRNIGNQVSLTDMNFLSVLEYATDVLKVEHIIVSGHYQCGGIQAAYEGVSSGLVENWVTPIKEIIRDHRAALDALPSQDDRINRIAELNVIIQAKNIFKTSIIHKLIQSGGYFPRIHGWVLDIGNGLIKEIPLPIETWKSEGVVPKNY